MADERNLVKPEELVSDEQMAALFDKWQENWPLPWDENMKQTVINFARAALSEFTISAIIPYTAGLYHRGFGKHPYDKCPDLEHAGCPYITLPGCFFQGGAVLIRKPASRDEDRKFSPKST